MSDHTALLLCIGMFMVFNLMWMVITELHRRKSDYYQKLFAELDAKLKELIK